LRHHPFWSGSSWLTNASRWEERVATPISGSRRKLAAATLSSGKLARACDHYGLQWRPWRN